MHAKEKSAQKTLRVTEERIGVSREMCSLDVQTLNKDISG